MQFDWLDRKLGRLHSKLDVIRSSQIDLDDSVRELHEQIDRVGRSVADLHDKLDARKKPK